MRRSRPLSFLLICQEQESVGLQIIVISERSSFIYIFLLKILFRVSSTLPSLYFPLGLRQLSRLSNYWTPLRHSGGGGFPVCAKMCTGTRHQRNCLVLCTDRIRHSFGRNKRYLSLIFDNGTGYDYSPCMYLLHVTVLVIILKHSRLGIETTQY